jgi:hypothetical protein
MVITSDLLEMKENLNYFALQTVVESREWVAEAEL